MGNGYYKVEPLLVGEDTHYIVRDPGGYRIGEGSYKTRIEADRIVARLECFSLVATHGYPKKIRDLKLPEEIDL